MRVGTRRFKTFFAGAVRDHPHACGDKRLSARTADRKEGSSPCVWGQATSSFVKLRRLGIIPMRVGTSVILAVVQWTR